MIVVDFPAPLVPNNPNTSPLFTSKEISGIYSLILFNKISLNFNERFTTPSFDLSSNFETVVYDGKKYQHDINSKDIFYRIVSDKLFFYDEASLICKKIVEIKLQCIVVKENF